MLVVRAEPFRTAGKDVLGDEGPFDELGGDVVSEAGAAGAEIAAACALKSLVFGEPVRARDVKTAEIGALVQGWSGHDAGIGHVDGEVVAIVVANAGERIAGDVNAVGWSGGNGGRGYLGLGAGHGMESQNGNGNDRGKNTDFKTHHHPAYRTAPRGDNAEQG